jgi:hypothetical protein
MTTTSTSSNPTSAHGSSPASAEVRAAARLLELPNIELPKRVAAVAVRCASCIRVRDASTEEAWSLREEGLPKARADDLAALAKSIENDEADPGRGRVLEVQDDLDSAVRRAEAAQLAEASVRGELMDEIRAATPAWRSHLAGDLAKTQTAYRKTITATLDEHARLVAAAQALAWLDNPDCRHDRHALGVLPDLLDQYGNPLTVPDLLARLDALADPR